MSKPKYDPTSLDEARRRLGILFVEFAKGHGMPVSPCSFILASDKAFISRYKRKNISFGTYDDVVGRASALWPASTPWPADVPRPPPGKVPTAARAMLDQRIAAAAAVAATATVKENS